MGRLAVKHELVKDVARIMSEQTGFDISVDDVRIDVSTITTQMCSAVVHHRVDGELRGETLVMYLKGVSKPKGEVTSRKLW